jgi:hypothetical protein
MRKLGLISCLAIASLMSVYACTVNSTPDPSKDTTTDEPLGITSEELGITTDALTPNACSVTLNFCDGSGAIGTDCSETGCGLSQAISACKSIVSQVGCAQHCNAVMRSGGANGTIIDTWRHQCGSTCCPEGDICAGTSCCSSGVVCGTTCCPSGDFCAGTRCCDGVHCGGGCPC